MFSGRTGKRAAASQDAAGSTDPKGGIAMESSVLCQQLLEHVARELPDEQEAVLGLAALASSHPGEVRLFVTEAMVLLLRHGRTVPESLASEVSRRLVGHEVAGA